MLTNNEDLAELIQRAVAQVLDAQPQGNWTLIISLHDVGGSEINRTEYRYDPRFNDNYVKSARNIWEKNPRAWTTKFTLRDAKDRTIVDHTFQRRASEWPFGDVTP